MRYILIFLCFVSCASKPKITHFSGEVMTMPFHIQVGGALSRSDEAKILDVINQTFGEIDLTFNHWNPASELSHLNDLPANIPFNASPELLKLLQLAQKITFLSENRYDPTAGKLISLWKKALKRGQLPSEHALNELSVGWEYLHIEDQITKDVGDIAIDLDGIAKGYGVDLLLERLKDLGFRHLYVEWAGEIRVLGHHPQGRPWKIQLGDQILALEDQAIATSGSDVQVYEIEDLYTHIIDPRTKKALVITEKAPKCVTVIGPSCAQADALATAGMLFPTCTEAQKWAASIEQQLKVKIIIK